MKNTELSVVLILLGSKQADCEGFFSICNEGFLIIWVFLKKTTESITKLTIEKFSLKGGVSVKLKSNNIFRGKKISENVKKNEMSDKHNNLSSLEKRDWIFYF